MLRITRSQRQDRAEFRLEGKLTGPWVAELETALSGEAAVRVCLLLGDVTYVDGAGVALLKELCERGVRIVERSQFVAALLEVNES